MRPGIGASGNDVFVTSAERPVAVFLGKEKREIALPAYAVAIQPRGGTIWIGTRETDPPRDAGANVARSLHEADESVRKRRSIRALVRVSASDGKVTPVSTFDPPATSFAVTERGIDVASPLRGGAIHRLPL